MHLHALRHVVIEKPRSTCCSHQSFLLDYVAYVVMENLHFPFSSKHQPGLGKHGDKILVF